MTFWEKLKALLQNKWMSEVTYLAAMAHVGWATLILLSAALLSNTNFKVCGYASGGLVGWALGKEWIYDANFELPKQTWRDNLGDTLGYLGGIALAWAVIALHLHFK